MIKTMDACDVIARYLIATGMLPERLHGRPLEEVSADILLAASSDPTDWHFFALYEEAMDYFNRDHLNQRKRVYEQLPV